jgi:hypothetical protein
MSIFSGILLSIPTWHPGDPGYSVTIAISAATAVLILGICAAISLRNPGFMRGTKKS